MEGTKGTKRTIEDVENVVQVPGFSDSDIPIDLTNSIEAEAEPLQPLVIDLTEEEEEEPLQPFKPLVIDLTEAEAEEEEPFQPLQPLEDIMYSNEEIFELLATFNINLIAL